MLGRTLRDPDHLESSTDDSPGLGLLPVETTFMPPKTLVRVQATGASTSRLFAGATHVFPAYEIQLGRTAAAPASGAQARLRRVIRIVGRDGEPTADVDGAVSAGATVEGTYLHGVLVDGGVRRCLLARLAQRKGSPVHPRWGTGSRSDGYDHLAHIVAGALDMIAMARLVGLAYPRSE